jgi:hypothetical protein
MNRNRRRRRRSSSGGAKRCYFNQISDAPNIKNLNHIINIFDGHKSVFLLIGKC